MKRKRYYSAGDKSKEFTIDIDIDIDIRDPDNVSTTSYSNTSYTDPSDTDSSFSPLGNEKENSYDYQVVSTPERSDLIGSVKSFTSHYRIPSLDNDNQESNVAPIRDAMEYYLQSNHTHLFRYSWKWRTIFILFTLFGIANARFYIPVAEDYMGSNNQSDWSPYYEFGAASQNLAILLLAALLFFDIHFKKIIPCSLQSVLVALQTTNERLLENTAIGFIALLSTVSIANILFGLNEEDPSVFFDVILDGTTAIWAFLLNLFSAKLILTEKLFRLPFLPIEFLLRKSYTLYQNCKMSQEKRQISLLAKKEEKKYDEIRNLLQNSFEIAKENIQSQAFLKNCRGLTCHVLSTYRLRNRFDVTITFGNIVSYTIEAQHYCRIPSSLNRILRRLCGYSGALWTAASAVGCYATIYNHIYQQTNGSSFGSFFSGITIYSMIVLFASLGMKFSTELYDYLTVWKKEVSKIPMAIKFYPKIFLCIMGLNAFFSLFSYSVPLQLLRKEFTYGWGKPLLPLLENCVYSGTPFLSFISVYHLVCQVFLLLVEHMSNGLEKELVIFIKELKQFIDMIPNMKGQELEKELVRKFPLEQAQIIGKSGAKKFKRLIGGGDMSLGNSSKSKYLFRIFCCKKGQEEKSQLLAGNQHPYHPSFSNTYSRI